jgi:hypothetical protein
MKLTICTVATAVAAVYLRRSCLAVLAAYEVGREVERYCHRRHGCAPARQPAATRAHGGLERARPGAATRPLSPRR